jgi:hypothetical protein
MLIASPLLSVTLPLQPSVWLDVSVDWNLSMDIPVTTVISESSEFWLSNKLTLSSPMTISDNFNPSNLGPSSPPADSPLLRASASFPLTEQLLETKGFGQEPHSASFPLTGQLLETKGFGQEPHSASFPLTIPFDVSSPYTVTPQQALWVTSAFTISSQLRGSSEITSSFSPVLIYGIAGGVLVLVIGVALFFMFFCRREHETTVDGETELSSSNISMDTTAWAESELAFVTEENSLRPAATFSFGGVDFDEARYPGFFQ